MRTGEKARTLALYTSNCCHAELIFGKPDIFSCCPRCEADCSWAVEEKLVTCEELERMAEREAA